MESALQQKETVPDAGPHQVDAASRGSSSIIKGNHHEQRSKQQKGYEEGTGKNHEGKEGRETREEK
jgi:hypothetical protein